MLDVIPYEIAPLAGIKANGGVSTCIPIPFPSRSIITKLIIVQTDGTPVNFTAALFNSDTACLSESESASGPDGGGDVDLLPPDLYRVTPDMTGTSGKLVFMAGAVGSTIFATGTVISGIGFPFFNQDEPNPSSLGNARVIYLRLTPSGSATNNEFAVVLGANTW
jgi:hypothetical protein